MIYGELQTKMIQEDENMVMKAVRKVGVNVDEEELIKALQYDRNQYTKGYEDGKNEVLDKIKAEIEQKLGTHGNISLYNRAIYDVLMIVAECKGEIEEEE